MSYARFSGASDVYVYHHYMGFIECCGCSITSPEGGEDFGFHKSYTAREALEHLDLHISNGHMVPERAYERIRFEYPDLDAPIEPYTA